MFAASTLPGWLSFSNLAWITTGVVAAGIVIALLALAGIRSIAGKGLVTAMMIGVVITGVWYRGYMTDSRKTCSTTLFSAHVRTPGCPIH